MIKKTVSIIITDDTLAISGIKNILWEELRRMTKLPLLADTRFLEKSTVWNSYLGLWTASIAWYEADETPLFVRRQDEPDDMVDPNNQPVDGRGAIRSIYSESNND